MGSTTLITLMVLIMLVYTVSFLQYMKYRSQRKRNQSRILQLPLFMAFLIGPLLFFMINNRQRREQKNFMEGKRRFS